MSNLVEILTARARNMSSIELEDGWMRSPLEEHRLAARQVINDREAEEEFAQEMFYANEEMNEFCCFGEGDCDCGKY